MISSTHTARSLRSDTHLLLAIAQSISLFCFDAPGCNLCTHLVIYKNSVVRTTIRFAITKLFFTCNKYYLIKSNYYKRNFDEWMFVARFLLLLSDDDLGANLWDGFHMDLGAMIPKTQRICIGKLRLELEFARVFFDSSSIWLDSVLELGTLV